MNSLKKIQSRLVPALLVVVTCALVVGCSSRDPDDVSFDAIIDDLTPELVTLTQRQVDIERNMAVTSNQNLRMIWEDMGRAWYVDHPSRLSPYPVPYTSGSPR